MNVYDVFDKINNMDNMDRLDEIFGRRCFQTSVITNEVRNELKVACGDIFKLGEVKVYEFIKNGYKLKM